MNVAAGVALPKWSLILRITIFACLTVLVCTVALLAEGYYQLERRMDAGRADRAEIIQQQDRILASLGMASGGAYVSPRSDPYLQPNP